jgi:hypothetical protein
MPADHWNESYRGTVFCREVDADDHHHLPVAYYLACFGGAAVNVLRGLGLAPTIECFIRYRVSCTWATSCTCRARREASRAPEPAGGGSCRPGAGGGSCCRSRFEMRVRSRAVALTGNDRAWEFTFEGLAMAA